MATTSYLPEIAGGMVAAAAFHDESGAAKAVALLRGAGVRMQDLSVVAADRRKAERLAGTEAWTPWKIRKGLLARVMPAGVPAEVRRRYPAALRNGAVILIAAADGQPVDTLAALFAQAGGDAVERWWQVPGPLFAPPELAGPF